MKKRIMMIRWSIVAPYLNWERAIIKAFTESKKHYKDAGIPMWIYYLWAGIISPFLIVCTILSVIETVIKMVNYILQSIIFGDVFIGFNNDGSPRIVRWNG